MKEQLFVLGKPLVLAVLSWTGLTTAINAMPITIYNTGACAGANAAAVNCSGGLLPYGAVDNNYQFTLRDDGGTTGSGSSRTVAPVGASSVNPAYVAADSLSEWLSPVGGVGATATFGGLLLGNTSNYTGQTTFDLSGFDAASLILSLQIASDNFASVLVNGSMVFTPGCVGGGSGVPFGNYCMEQWSSTTLDNGSIPGGWLPGMNTLRFVVTNTQDPSPTGLRVEVSGDASPASNPEPGTLVLLGLGLAGFGLLRLRAR
jgi:hypothetical protein